MRINMKNKVKRILLLKKQSRDNDFYLMYWILKQEFENLNINHDIDIEFDKTNIINILSLLKERKLSHPSGIMRARRKLQEEDSTLRGDIWDLRHKEQEVVKADLGYNTIKPIAQ